MRNEIFSVWVSVIGAGALCSAPAIASPALAVQAAPTASPTAGAALPAVPNALTYRVTWDQTLMSKPFSGRVCVFITTARGTGEPRAQVSNWFRPPIILGRDVAEAAPGIGVELKVGQDGTVHFPADSGKIIERFAKAGKVRVQAVARVCRTCPVPGVGEGDVYSEPVDLTVSELDGKSMISGAAIDAPSGAVVLTLSKTVVGKPFGETAKLREFTMISPMLSAFHGFEYTVKAGIALPDGWSEEAAAAGKTWPAVYSVTGFGGDHASVKQMGKRFAPGCILIVPDANNFYGHSVFADSANCGPWGAMLMQELIPAIEAKFGGPIAEAGKGGGIEARLAASSSRRFATGVSSGGWASLWLVASYPDWFDSCWSHVPDPVDFRDFQRIDLTASDANMFRTERGERRPIARMGETVSLYYDDFVAMESALGPGGQVMSFEAVFSPKGADGKPLPLFDRATGKVNPRVAKSWESYDIRIMLENNWERLGPKLAGKIHVFAGEVDNFYLEGAARLLKAALKKLGSDAEVEIIPDMGHQLSGKGQAAMLERIKQREAAK